MIWLRTAHSGSCWQRSVLNTQMVQGNDNDEDDDGMLVTHSCQKILNTTEKLIVR